MQKLQDYKFHFLALLCFSVFIVAILVEWPYLFGNSFLGTIIALISTTNVESHTDRPSNLTANPTALMSSSQTPTLLPTSTTIELLLCLQNPNPFFSLEALKTNMLLTADKLRNPNIVNFGQPFDITPARELRIPEFEILRLKGKGERDLGNCSNGWPEKDLVTWIPCKTWNLMESNHSLYPNRVKSLKLIVTSPVLSNWRFKLETFKIDAWLALPSLPPNQRYLVANVIIPWFYGFEPDENYHHYYNYRMNLIKRKDFIMLGLDLVEFLSSDIYDANCSAAVDELKRNGVTFIGHTSHEEAMTIFKDRYFSRDCFQTIASFRGTCNSRARGFLAKMFANYTESDALVEFRENVGNDFCFRRGFNVSSIIDKGPIDYTTMLNGTKFCLLPRGDRRWTHRLNDCLSWGLIPVFITAGVTRPFELLIPWDRISMALTEESIQNKSARFLLDELARIPDDVVREVQKRVHLVYMEYFSSHDRRAAAILHESLLYYEKINQPFWNYRVDPYHYLLERCAPEKMENRLIANQVPKCDAKLINSCS